MTRPDVRVIREEHPATREDGRPRNLIDGLVGAFSAQELALGYLVRALADLSPQHAAAIRTAISDMEQRVTTDTHQEEREALSDLAKTLRGAVGDAE
jgi:hypothetical protein